MALRFALEVRDASRLRRTLLPGFRFPRRWHEYLKELRDPRVRRRRALARPSRRLLPARRRASRSLVSRCRRPRGVARSDGGSFHPVARLSPRRDDAARCADPLSCLEQAFGNIAFREGPKPALALFDEVDGNRRRTAAAIESSTSSAPRRSHATTATSRRTFAQGTPACASGYYHGILERALVRVKSRRRRRWHAWRERSAPTPGSGRGLSSTDVATGWGTVS